MVSQVLNIKEICTLPAELQESSGLLSLNSGNTFWTHNDGGNDPVLYEIDTLCNILRKVLVRNVTNVDWEEITVDSEGNVFIGDFGNNNNDRRDLKIYCINHLQDSKNDTVEATVISFRYVSQTDFPPDGTYRNFDMEAFIWFEGNLHLFSKNRTNPFSGYCYHHTIPDKPGDYTTTLIDSFQAGKGIMQQYWVTGAAVSPNHNSLILLSYDKFWLFNPLIHTNFFSTKSKTINFTSLTQKEAIFFVSDHEIWLTDEYYSLLRNGGKLYQGFINPLLQIFKAGDVESFISPNPTRDFLNIEFEGKFKISIWDPMTNSMAFPTIGEDQMINVSFLRPGIYFIAIETSNKRFIQKFVKM
ncbi:MAG: T9SS type A sorting domain-containing protein [Saprospiraceae bacterium]